MIWGAVLISARGRCRLSFQRSHIRFYPRLLLQLAGGRADDACTCGPEAFVYVVALILWSQPSPRAVVRNAWRNVYVRCARRVSTCAYVHVLSTRQIIIFPGRGDATGASGARDVTRDARPSPRPPGAGPGAAGQAQTRDRGRRAAAPRAVACPAVGEGPTGPRTRGPGTGRAADGRRRREPRAGGTLTLLSLVFTAMFTALHRAGLKGL